jgi:flagellar assembly factor FliW
MYAYSVSVPPCHLLSKYRMRLKRPLLKIIRISTENSSHVLVVVVLIISAPMKNSKLSVK